MKNFILSMGESLLNFFVIIGILIAIISAAKGGTYGVLTAIAIIVFVIAITFLLYLLIDIRDKITEQTQEMKKAIRNLKND